tara:strand:+ start:589 stop:1554 length:966 start_codon:yes stop_codon:yes gene_type:complete
MSKLKISYLWLPNFEETVIFHLLKILSTKEVKIVNPFECDILFIGPGDVFSFKRRFYNKIKKTFFPNIEKKFYNIDLYSFNRKFKPLRVSFATESVRNKFINSDYSISSEIGVNNKNHLRFPYWKEHIDWSHENIVRDNKSANVKRFGFLHDLNTLMRPQGEDFLKKKNMCIFTSHMEEPRLSIYESFLSDFVLDGYGPYFDKKLNNHNSSNFTKFEVMKKYAMNLCPENIIYPGCYSEKVIDAFASKCLPVSCMDINVKEDFNDKAFINLVNHFADNFQSIKKQLKDPTFLKKFTSEPLITVKPNLNNEKLFIEKLISNI